ncbi:MAG: hypothetical protein LBK99_10145 [Opitutaceae bacterium]|nr:hypothetical protein [Opitutaceae bacterium]
MNVAPPRGTGFQPVDGAKRRLPAHLRGIPGQQLTRPQTTDLAWRQWATLRVAHGLEARATSRQSA